MIDLISFLIFFYRIKTPMIMINYESAWLYTIKARKYICISREFNMAYIYLHISSIMFTDYNTYGAVFLMT